MRFADLLNKNKFTERINNIDNNKTNECAIIFDKNNSSEQANISDKNSDMKRINKIFHDSETGERITYKQLRDR